MCNPIVRREWVCVPVMMLCMSGTSMHVGAGPGGWNYSALPQEELRGGIQRTVQEVEGLGTGTGGRVRHDERVVRCLLEGDGGQRMAKRIFKDRNMRCGMLCHLTYVEYVTFSHDPPAFNRAGFV